MFVAVTALCYSTIFFILKRDIGPVAFISERPSKCARELESHDIVSAAFQQLAEVGVLARKTSGCLKCIWLLGVGPFQARFSVSFSEQESHIVELYLTVDKGQEMLLDFGYVHFLDKQKY